VNVFERRGATLAKASPVFDMRGQRTALASILRPNASVISTLAQLKHRPSELLRDAAARISCSISGDAPITDAQAAQYYLGAPSDLAALNREIKRLDLGLRKIEVQHTPMGPVTMFEHEGLSSPLAYGAESHGTRQFVRIFPFLVRTLETGGVAVIDEIDSSVHPLVLPEIVRWFYDPNRNRHNAQLWITCQNPALLDHLSKEEVLLCEKDMLGRTTIYALSDIKGVRRNENLYDKYLDGAFGAVPRIG
jgi:hypothetical protein